MTQDKINLITELAKKSFEANESLKAAMMQGEAQEWIEREQQHIKFALLEAEAHEALLRLREAQQRSIKFNDSSHFVSNPLSSPSGSIKVSQILFKSRLNHLYEHI